MEPVLLELYSAICDGKKALVTARVQQALDAGLAPAVILQDGMIAALREVGGRFERGDCFVPEMLVAAQAMQAGLNVLKPHLVRANVPSAGTAIVGTVMGDVHDIGKNLVAMMLEGAGYRVQDLGVNNPPAKFVQAIQEQAPDVVCMSALLTTTMPYLKNTIDAMVEARVRDRVRVIVGGAPVTQEYATQIGADGYARDASQAVAVVDGLVKTRRQEQQT